VIALDLLPWPWGEEILAGLFVARAGLDPRRLREALAWSAAHGGRRRGRVRLALALLAHHGRATARSALVGLERPDALRPYLDVRGEEHLSRAAPGVVLLGFHVGLPITDVALRILGHRLTWLGGSRVSRGWARPAWRGFLEPSENLALSDEVDALGGMLHRARRVLADGGTIYMMGDGQAGREAFRVALPGGALIVRAGWLALRRHTGATVLPVLTHRDGRGHVITIHPPLPARVADPDADAEACRQALVPLLADYERRFPEQCHGPALGAPGRRLAVQALMAPGGSLRARRSG
jgi:lauroyl/myristoyl acyltransferase